MFSSINNEIPFSLCHSSSGHVFYSLNLVRSFFLQSTRIDIVFYQSTYNKRRIEQIYIYIKIYICVCVRETLTLFVNVCVKFLRKMLFKPNALNTVYRKHCFVYKIKMKYKHKSIGLKPPIGRTVDIACTSKYKFKWLRMGKY